MNHSEQALELFYQGYSCAQAVACAYEDVVDLSQEMLYRLSEGFGGGMGHSGHACGSCSAMVMIASYLLCPNMKEIGISKEKTYPVIKQMVDEFHGVYGSIDCFEILRVAPKGLNNGKRNSCIQCVKQACKELDALIDSQKGED